MSPYTDPKKKLAHGRAYYRKHREEKKKEARERYWQNHAIIRKRRAELNTVERKRKNALKEKLRYAAYRELVIEAYGGRCACCGENEVLFLEVDHINNDGRAHRKVIGRSAKALVYWLINHGFPDGFQLLCSNCNQGKKRNGGTCPHKAKRDP